MTTLKNKLVNPGFAGGAAAESLIRASFSPDGRFVVSGSEKGQVRVWESQEGKRVRTPLQVRKKCRTRNECPTNKISTRGRLRSRLLFGSTAPGRTGPAVFLATAFCCRSRIHQSLGTACCLRDVAWHPHQHVLALAGYGQDAPVLLYCGEARADKRDKASPSKVASLPCLTRLPRPLEAARTP